MTRAGKDPFSSPLNAAGFSYVEILLAIVLIAICLVPAMEALGPAFSNIAGREELSGDFMALRSKLEEVLAAPWSELEDEAVPEGSPLLPTIFSETPYTMPDGRLITLNVYISGYDGNNADQDDDPFTGTDSGLLYVKVAVKGTQQQMETLVSMF